MSTSTAVLSLDQWQILFYETMAALLRAQEAVKRQLGFWGVLNGLWKASRDLKTLNESLKLISEVPDGVLNDEALKSQIPQLRKLLMSVEELIDTAKRTRLTNRSLTNAPLGLIRLRGEYIADYLEAIELSLDPEVLREIDEGRGQIERGDFEVMEQLY
jgi:ribosomal protein L17